MRIYYISFCDPVQFRGAAFIETDGGVVDVQKYCDEEGITPANVETLAFRYDSLSGVPGVPPSMRNRLLSEEEILKFWPDAKDVMSFRDHLPDVE
jgi:hypothetical protein